MVNERQRYMPFLGGVVPFMFGTRSADTSGHAGKLDRTATKAAKKWLQENAPETLQSKARSSDPGPAILKAARSGFTHVLQYLSEHGATNFGSTPGTWSPLHVAALGGHDDTVRWLLEKHCDTSALTPNGWTPLSAAAIGGDAPTVRRLLPHSVIDYTDLYGRTPLHLAAAFGHASVVAFLADQGANVSLGDSVGRTPFFVAIQNGHLSAAKQLLQHGANINAPATNGCTPLTVAMQTGNQVLINWLKEQGARMPQSPVPAGVYPAADQEATIQWMQIKIPGFGLVDENITLPNKRTPLHVAAHSGFMPAVRWLSAHGFSPTEPDAHGKTPIDMAVERHHSPVAHWLRGERNNSHTAGDRAIMWLSKTVPGFTPDATPQRLDELHCLHVAAAAGNVAAVRWLCMHGANTTIVDATGCTPQQVATEHGYGAVAQILEEQGQQVRNERDLTDENGMLRVIPGTFIRPLPPEQQVPERIPKRLTSKNKSVPFPCCAPCQTPPATGYRVVKSLGQGTYGVCVLAVDTVTQRRVAVKVIRAHPDYLAQALLEISVLIDVIQAPDESAETVLQLLSYFYCDGGHLCLVTPLHGMNLYQHLERHQHRGLPLRVVRHVAQQLLSAVARLHSLGICHCDIKPENIVQRHEAALELHTAAARPEITLIDLGSACYISHGQMHQPQYIQSRYYRAPEVLLGLPYGAKIDSWSIGCVCAELFIGLPLFPATSEYDLMRRVVEYVEMPPLTVLVSSQRSQDFFTGLTAGCQRYQMLSRQPEYIHTSQRRIATAVVDEMVRQLRQQNAELTLEAATFQLRPQMRTFEQYRSRVRKPVERPQHYYKVNSLESLITTTYKRQLRDSENAVENEMLGFVHFLRGLLRTDPDRRWSVAEALQHPWLALEPEQLGQAWRGWDPQGTRSPLSSSLQLADLVVAQRRATSGTISHKNGQQNGRPVMTDRTRLLLEAAGISPDATFEPVEAQPAQTNHNPVTGSLATTSLLDTTVHE